MFKNFKKEEEEPVKSPLGTTTEWNKADAPVAPTFGEEAPQFGPSDFSAPVVSPGISQSSRNVLNSDVSVVGTLRFEDELLVDGSVEGEITSEGVLTVGANASILSKEKNKVAIRTKSAIVHGKVSGNIVVTERVELAATAEVVGDITAAKIAIQEGAVFIGRSTVGVASPGMSAAPSPAPATKPAKGDKGGEAMPDLLS